MFFVFEHCDSYLVVCILLVAWRVVFVLGPHVDVRDLGGHALHALRLRLDAGGAVAAAGLILAIVYPPLK